MPARPSRGPRNRRRKEARPDEILAAALSQFAATGYRATRLQDIARRAGIAKATIYLYFDNKQTLFEAVLRHAVADQLLREREQLHRSAASAEQLLRELLITFRDRILRTEARHLLPLLMAEGRHFPELASFYYREVVAPAMEMLGDILRRGVASGEFRDDSLEHFPQILTSGAIAGIMWQALFAELEPLALEELVEKHLEVVLRGIKVAR